MAIPNSEAALIYGFAIGGSILVYWLGFGLYFYFKDSTNRTSIHADLLRDAFYAKKGAEGEKRKVITQLRDRTERAISYLQVAYEFFTLLSFSFLPTIPWSSNPNFKAVRNILTLLVIRIPGLNAVWVFIGVSSLYLLCGLVFICVRFVKKWNVGRGSKVGSVTEASATNEKNSASKWTKITHRLFRITPQLLLELSLIPVSRIFLTIVDCKYIGAPEGAPYLVSTPSVLCWQGWHLYYAAAALTSFAVLYPTALWWSLWKSARDGESIPRSGIVVVMLSVLATSTSTLLSSYVSLSTTSTSAVLTALFLYNIWVQPALGEDTVFNHYKSASLCGTVYGSIIAVCIIIAELGYPLATPTSSTPNPSDWPVYTFLAAIVPLMIAAGYASVMRARYLEKKALSDIANLTKSKSNALDTAKNAANLALVELNQSKIVATGGVEGMLVLIKSDQPSDVIRHAARCLANLTARSVPTRELLIKNDISCIVESIAGDWCNAAAKTQLCRVVYHLCLTKTLRTNLVNQMGKALTDALMRCYRLKEESQAISAARSISALSADPLWHDKCSSVPSVHPRIVVPMIKWTERDGSDKVKMAILPFIVNLLENKKSAQLCIGHGLASALATVYHCNDPQAIFYADKAAQIIRRMVGEPKLELEREMRLYERGRQALKRLREEDTTCIV